MAGSVYAASVSGGQRELTAHDTMSELGHHPLNQHLTHDGDDKNKVKTFTLYSEPIGLRYGEVTIAGTWATQTHLPLPKEVVDHYADGTRNMAVRGFSMDFVRRDASGDEQSVPLYELYDHHHFVQIYGSDADDGRYYGLDGLDRLTFGSSFEYRGTHFAYEQPYRRVISRPTSWLSFFHLINTRLSPGVVAALARHGEVRELPSAMSMTQCPCTPQRSINTTDQTVDGLAVYDFDCPPWLEDNRACNWATYTGGMRCCAYGDMFVTDTEAMCATPQCEELPIDYAQFKITFEYEDDDVSVADTGAPAAEGGVAHVPARNLRDASCCDLTSSSYDEPWRSTFEFDVDACPHGTPPGECVSTHTAVLPLDRALDEKPEAADALVEVAFMLPHVHEGGLSIEVQDAVTNATLCKASLADGGVVYGASDVAGDERGYITGFRSCSWDGAHAPVYRRAHPMRITATYDASRPIHGAMARMIIAVHDRDHKALAATSGSASGHQHGMHMHHMLATARARVHGAARPQHGGAV